MIQCKKFQSFKVIATIVMVIVTLSLSSAVPALAKATVVHENYAVPVDEVIYSDCAGEDIHFLGAPPHGPHAHPLQPGFTGFGHASGILFQLAAQPFFQHRQPSDLDVEISAQVAQFGQDGGDKTAVRGLPEFS